MMQKMKSIVDYLSQDFLGGPKLIKLSWVINFQKGATLPFILGLIYFYHDKVELTPLIWIYAALHGGYGIAWWMKDLSFPDPSWQIKVTVGGAFMSVLLVLGPYWLLPYLLVAGYAKGLASMWMLMLAVLIFVIGLTLMIGSDAQKYFVLRIRKGLITDGFFKRVRHPNYLGEMMIYGAFALMVNHILAWLIIFLVWVFVFLPNIYNKERSLSRYPEWQEYCRRTGLLWPLFRF